MVNNNGNPLGLPAGSVRAIIALVSIIAILLTGIVGYFKGLTGIPEEMWQVVLIVIAFYFGFRSNGGVIQRIPPKEEIINTIKEVVNG